MRFLLLFQPDPGSGQGGVATRTGFEPVLPA